MQTDHERLVDTIINTDFRDGIRNGASAIATAILKELVSKAGLLEKLSKEIREHSK